MRPVLGILAGVALALLTITLAETVNGLIFSRPSVDWYDPAAVSRLMAAMPLSAKLMVVGGWFVGALLGAALAVATTRRNWTGWIPAGAVLVGGLINALAIDHPLWMDAGAVLAPMLGGALGILFTRGRTAAT